MAASKLRPRLAGLAAVLRHPPRGVTALVWGGAVGTLCWLAARDGGTVRIAGYAEARCYEVAALVEGRVASVVVRAQQDVEVGEIMATLDDEQTAVALRAAHAELARLHAERRQTLAALQAARNEREAQHRAELRRFAADLEQANVELLRTQAAVAEDERNLERVDIELGRLQQLGSALVAPDRMQDQRLLREALATRVHGQRTVLTELRGLFEKARARAQEFAEAGHQLPDPAVELAPHDQAIAAQQARIDQLRLAQREMVLRAPIAGRVAALLRQPGEVVKGGEAVVTVIEREPSTVVAHLPEEYVQRVAPGTSAVLWRQGNRSEAFDAVVVYTGAEIERMPRRVDAAATIPRWGFPVHLTCPRGRGLVAGEYCTVVFRDTGPLLGE